MRTDVHGTLLLDPANTRSPSQLVAPATLSARKAQADNAPCLRHAPWTQLVPGGLGQPCKAAEVLSAELCRAPRPAWIDGGVQR